MLSTFLHDETEEQNGSVTCQGHLAGEGQGQVLTEQFRKLLCIYLLGPEQWCNRLILCLRCQHPSWALIHIWLLLFLDPVSFLWSGEAMVDGPSPTRETWRNLLALDQFSPGISGEEQKMEYLSPHVSPSLCKSAFQVKANVKKRFLYLKE